MGGGDRVLSCLALLVTAAMAVHALADAPAVDPPLPPIVEKLLEDRIDEIAEAIAEAEGYYAPGEHDGHSLPWRLNNPGALKKPALEAASLPTWQDTGLVIFPTADMGWAALRHQIRLMLSGDSRIYHPSDTIRTVAAKYTGGDDSEVWGARVAARLGVPEAATLADLATASP
jgi:hypothetical protein